jgi:Dolichyl-phosphate-mannose-protein mannosyltransferase
LKKATALNLILALSFLLFLAGIWWGLPDVRGWAPDEITPSNVIDGLRAGFSRGWSGRYPPFHYYLLSIVYGPVLVLHKLHILDLRQLPNYTILFYLGRLISVLMGLAIVYFVYRTGREIMDRTAALAAAGLAALIVPLEYYAKTVNLDVPYLFWFAASLFFYVRILKVHRLKDYVLFAAAAMLAVTTKDQAYGLYLLSPIPVILADWKRKKTDRPDLSLVRSLCDRAYLAAGAIAAGMFVLIHNFAFNFHGFLRHVVLITGGASESYRMFPRTLGGEVRLLGLTLRQIQGSFGWPALLLCAGGLIAVLVRRKDNSILRTLPLLAVSYYAFYIAVILFNCDRYNLPLCLILALFGGWAVSAIWQAGGGRFKAIKAAAIGLVFAYGILYSASVDALMITDARYETERWIGQNIPEDATIGRATFLEYAPRLRGYDSFNLHFVLDDLKIRKPDYVVLAPAFVHAYPAGTPESEFFTRLTSEAAGYNLIFRSKTARPWLFIRYRNAETNIDAINVETLVYRRRNGSLGTRSP